MKITATEEYGMRCMVRLAARAGEVVSLAELARSEGIALPFAAKVLARLRRARLVTAVRGRNGGYVLAEPPQRITVATVLAALGTPLFDTEYCRRAGHSAEGGCGRLGDCVLRPVWLHLDALLTGFFARTTLADLLANERETSQQLADRFPLSATVQPPMRPSARR